MIDDPFKGEIYVKSRCISQENTVARLLEDFLESLGYVQQSTRTWARNSRLVVVCLVDDFSIFKNDLSEELAKQYEKNTIVLTENFVSKQNDYQILQLPKSFYSTFSYTPDLLELAPDRDFHLFMNRNDEQRMAIFDEFCKQRGLSTVDYIAMKAFNTPYRNHTLFIEQACVQSHLNLIVETYASNTTIALSEKIFRALQTPAPWMLYGCKGSVGHLKTLGFDVLDDIVNHEYDSVCQANFDGRDKIQPWMNTAIDNLNSVKQIKLDVLKNRCASAAEHNRLLLQSWKKDWPFDFARWLASALKVLNS